MKAQPSLREPAESFYGEVRERRELPFLTLTEIVYPPHSEIPPHVHERPWFGFLLRGSVVEHFGNRSVECGPSILLFRVPGEVHADYFQDSGGHGVAGELSPAFLQAAGEHLGFLQTSREFEGGAISALLLRLYKELMSKDFASSLIIEGLTLELLGEAHRHCASGWERDPPRWLGRAKEFVEAHFAENLTLLQVAESVGIHPVHVARVFRRYCHCGVGEFVRRLRINFAYRQIVETNAPLVEIALAAGFCDQAHFSRTFKRMTGLTPSELRVSARPR